MATPIKRIEKDFLFKVLYDGQLPIIYLYHRIEYILRVEKPVKNELCLLADHPIPGLKPRKKMDLVFDYQGKVITFSLEIASLRDTHIVAKIPESLYKNLNRSHPRVITPPDLQIQFAFQGDRYSLSFPKIPEYTFDELADQKEPLPQFNDLISQMPRWVKKFASAYNLVLFKDAKPSHTIEEQLLAETGKVIFLPSTQGSLPQTDPDPRKRLVTEDMLKYHLECTGVGEQYLDDAVARFIRSKAENGIYSDLWVPILFHEYVVGYIHLWINEEGKPPFDYGVIDTALQFVRILAFSLKSNGYFDSGKIKNRPFVGKVIDISASGLLFAYPQSDLASTLFPDSDLMAKLISPQRTLTATAQIVRRYDGDAMKYFGCQFLDMTPDDIRFLFEFIYGKPFSDADAYFIAGRV
jgi:hypothetical protein